MTSPEISPLRYPGGKGHLAPFFGSLLATQKLPTKVFVEPFAGGAGAALTLLAQGKAKSVVLNDLDAGIAALWRSIFGQSEEFACLIETAPITIEAWRKHHATYLAREDNKDDLDLGFATFFLNRTNRSGILNAWPIGGLAQAGEWKLDCRFNRAALAARVRKLGTLRERVTVTQKDAIALIADYMTPGSFIYADPPYLTKGADLYLNAMSWEDHQALADGLAGSRGMWMVTYDHDARVGDLYPKFRRAEFALAHAAGKSHVGKEYAVFGDRLKVTSLDGLGRDGAFVE
jgi:DNA adenine methylase